MQVNTAASHGLRLGERSDSSSREASLGIKRAVVLVASQKTLPVAVTVLGQLAAAGVAPVRTLPSWHQTVQLLWLRRRPF